MPNPFRYLAKFDKDTFIIGLIFTITMGGLVKVNADPIYIIAWAALASVLYVAMRWGLLHVQVEEQKRKVRSSTTRKAKEVIDATATKSEKVALEKFAASVKRDRK